MWWYGSNPYVAQNGMKMDQFYGPVHFDKENQFTGSSSSY